MSCSSESMRWTDLSGCFQNFILDVQSQSKEYPEQGVFPSTCETALCSVPIEEAKALLKSIAPRGQGEVWAGSVAQHEDMDSIHTKDAKQHNRKGKKQRITKYVYPFLASAPGDGSPLQMAQPLGCTTRAPKSNPPFRLWNLFWLSPV